MVIIIITLWLYHIIGIIPMIIVCNFSNHVILHYFITIMIVTYNSKTRNINVGVSNES